ncbi:MAG: FAD-dependent thymidylate synthase [Desulfotalea sp.]
MIIVDPFYVILHDMDQSSLIERIEACGRICYKSEDRITPESSIPFVQNMVKHGHNSVLEMAAVTVRITCSAEVLASFYACQPKYLISDTVEAGILISGSIRAFREFYKFNPQNEIAKSCVNILQQKEPHLFSDLPVEGIEDCEGVKISKLSLSEVDKLAESLQIRHRFVAVRFITNRAVTHEIVRHRPVSYLQESQRYCRYSKEKFGNQVSFIKPMFYEEGTSEFNDWKKAMEQTETLYLKLLETSTPQAARTVLPNSCKTEIITFCNLVEWDHIFKLRTTKHAEPSMREVMIPLQEEMHKTFPAMVSC